MTRITDPSAVALAKQINDLRFVYERRAEGLDVWWHQQAHDLEQSYRIKGAELNKQFTNETMDLLDQFKAIVGGDPDAQEVLNFTGLSQGYVDLVPRDEWDQSLEAMQEKTMSSPTEQ